MRAAFLADASGLVLEPARSTSRQPRIPGIDGHLSRGRRMQRARRDLRGVRRTDPDARPWLRHAAWPRRLSARCVDAHPSRAARRRRIDDYEFVRVEGDGVHEMPVGPVHAGIIEPGHFRFSIVGEKVLRLEERLGYVHKGIERRFTELPMLGAIASPRAYRAIPPWRFPGPTARRSKAWRDATIPPRAAWLRALCLELERIANHLGDLGALGNDAGFAFGLAQFSRLKEELLRAIEQALRAALPDGLRSCPGGTRRRSRRPARVDARRRAA